MHEAMLYEKLRKNNEVRCRLCAHKCLIEDGKRGICQVRQNEGGTLYSLVYGKPIAGNVDPIEKKPLFHFLPGTTSYSIATIGCNFQLRLLPKLGTSASTLREETGGKHPRRRAGRVLWWSPSLDGCLRPCAHGLRLLEPTPTPSPPSTSSTPTTCMKLAVEAGPQERVRDQRL